MVIPPSLSSLLTAGCDGGTAPPPSIVPFVKTAGEVFAQAFRAQMLPLWLHAFHYGERASRLESVFYKAIHEINAATALVAELDEKYAISFVFQGAFGVALQPLDAAAKPQPATSPLALDKSGAWRGLQGGALYGLVVTEDAQAEEAARDVEQPGLDVVRLRGVNARELELPQEVGVSLG